jgi:FkbM family methyltransferase
VSRRVKQIGTVIDIGASDGRWSKTAMKFYPDAQYLLIEANPFHFPGLRVFEKMHSNVSACMAVAGDSVGQVFFDDSNPWGGIGCKERYNELFRPYPSTTVDKEVADRSLPPPYLLKLDTHGFETTIFMGAASVMDRSDVVVMEVYNTIAGDQPPFYEMSRLMREKGFTCVDISDILWHMERFLQMDMYFTREHAPGRQ